MKPLTCIWIAMLLSSMAFSQTRQATSLDGRKLYPMKLSAPTQARYDSLLAVAKENYKKDPSRLEHVIWLGRRTAYLGRYKEAIKIFKKGIQQFPNSPELYRHRGHRYVSIRKFDRAIADFEKAAALAEDRVIEIEPDGLPNKLNTPLSNLHFNIYYHLGLAHYLKGDFDKALPVYHKCMEYSVNDDLKTATADWLYMTYQRLGMEEKASELLQDITADMNIIENDAYHKRLLMYKGQIKPETLLDLNANNEDQLLQLVTQGYGVGNWYWYNGQKAKAQSVFTKIINTSYWSAFGYIAAEADLFRK